ncbi:MAG TPA: hypothetical protein VMB73_16320 [Acetobacteraceae bacterium]|nr:hypothetical protein [Acetobacteraceae bacterium]
MWAQTQDRLRQNCHGVDDMLAIVEEQQELLCADCPGNSLRRWLSANQRESKRAGDGRGHKSGIRQRRQFDQPSAILEFIDDAARNLQSQTGFANATGSGQRHHAIGGDEVPQSCHGPRPAKQACDSCRQIGNGPVAPRFCLLRTSLSPRHALTLYGPVTEQSIAAARLRLQQGPIWAKGFANRCGVNTECAVQDDRTWPDTVHQFFFGDEFACRLNQYFDDSKCAPANRNC